MNQNLIFAIPVLTASLLTIIIFLPNAEAITTPPHMIGIQLSQTCLIMEKNHISSNCLGYDKLKQFDNSNFLLTGKWIDAPYYHRLAPHVKNGYRGYTGNYIIMVDPDSDFTTHAKMIIIQSGNFTYVNINDSVGSNHTRIEYHDRYVAGCMEARVIPDLNWINDTITYLKSDCTKTNYDEKVIVKTNDTPFDLNNPYSSLHYDIKALKQTKHSTPNCITKKCDTPKDPYKKKAWG